MTLSNRFLSTRGLHPNRPELWLSLLVADTWQQAELHRQIFDARWNGWAQAISLDGLQNDLIRSFRYVEATREYWEKVRTFVVINITRHSRRTQDEWIVPDVSRRNT